MRVHISAKLIFKDSMFWEKFWVSCPDCPWEHVSNLKSVALTVLELLAFNAQKFWGSRDHGHAPF